MADLHALSNRWPEISSLLDEALALPATRHDAWLDGLTGPRAELKDMLRGLLAARARADDPQFLLAPPEFALPLGVGAGLQPGLEAGQRVGPYRLVALLGQGGMGAVWRAERADGAFSREVALKLPLLNRLRPELRTRFLRERDILARLEHPNIARLYDGGLDTDGLPYLAMEFVEGEPIDRWCDVNRLAPAERIALFMQVLDAVQFAHARLVIHRDLKPSNILVTPQQQVRLLDFGIAKLLDDGADGTVDSELTRASGRALTPEYASPEQIRGEPLTIASDIYSLGVVLYQLLSGQRPYRLKFASAAQLEQAILAVDPPRPSSVVDAAAAPLRGTTQRRLARLLAGDLDTIVLKALAKAPSNRYLTIAEMADDLRRHASGAPVLARPPSWSYRSRKFVARNRLAVGAAGAVAIALLTGTGVSLWQAHEARQQALRAEQVKAFVLSIFRDADTSSGGSRKTSAVDLLQQARQRLEAADVRDPAIRTELLTAIGTSLYALGEYADGRGVLEEASRFGRRELGHEHPATVAADYGLARTLVLLDAANPQLPALVDALEHTMVRSHSVLQLAGVLRMKAALQIYQGRPDDAVASAQRAVSLVESGADEQYRRETQSALDTLISAMQVARRPGRLPFARRSHELAQALYPATSTTRLSARAQHAHALVTEGDADLGVTELKSVLAQQVALLGPDHRDVELTHEMIMQVATRRGDVLTALESSLETVRSAERRSGGRATASVAWMRAKYGMTLAQAHRDAEAEQQLRTAVEEFGVTPDAFQMFARAANAEHALALARLGRLAEADRAFERVLSTPAANDAEAASIGSRLGMLRLLQGRYPEAMALLRQQRDVASKQGNATGAANALAALGVAQLRSGDPVGARATLQQAASQFERLHPRLSPARADLLLHLARAHFALGELPAARAASGDAEAFWRSFDASNRQAGLAGAWHARILLAQGEHLQAAEHWRRARPLLAASTLEEDRRLVAELSRELDKTPRRAPSP